MCHFHFVLGCLFGDVILPMGPNEFIRIRCEKLHAWDFFTSRLKSLKMHFIFLPMEYWHLNCHCSVHCSWLDHFLVIPFFYMQKGGSVSVKWHGIYIVKISYKYVLSISAIGVVGTMFSRLHKSVSRILVFLMTEQEEKECILFGVYVLTHLLAKADILWSFKTSGYCPMSTGTLLPTFRRSVMPPSSGWSCKWLCIFYHQTAWQHWYKKSK